jgi:hypothetical protein
MSDTGILTAPRPWAPAPSAPPPAASAAPASPLTEAHFAMVSAAARSRKGVKRAAGTAFSSAVVTLGIGALTIPVAVLSLSASGLVMGVAICGIGAVEYIGYQRMRKADPAAAKILALNQLAFLGLITLYCLFQMLTFSTEGARAAALSPEVREQLAALPGMRQALYEQIDRWAPVLTYSFYSLVIFLSIGFQGGMALYYHTRRKCVESFNRSTPGWARRLFVLMDA